MSMDSLQLRQRAWRAALALTCLVMVCAGVTGAAAKTRKAVPQRAAAGSLDPSFGNGGKAMIAFPAEDSGGVGVKYDVPFQFTAGLLAMAPAPGGKIVVAGSTKVARLLPNGKLDRRFGSGGSTAIPRPPGQSFVLADVATDSAGRVLVAGSARPQPSASTPDPLLSSAVVMRFGADGSLDPSFGKEGMVITDFGIEPPAIGPVHYKGAAVGLRSLVVDSANRPLLTGGSVTEIVRCYPDERAVSTAFVARLTETGGLDLSFGSGGLRQIAEFSSFGQGSLLRSGTLLTVGSSKPDCNDRRDGSATTLVGLGPEGIPSPNFGFAGFRAVGNTRTPIVAVAPSGKIVLLGVKRKKSQLLMRLLPNGGTDPSFGRIGRVTLVLPKDAALTAVAIDRRNRLLLAGRSSKRVSKAKNNPLRRSTFLLGRMDSQGSIDRSFGRRGSVRTGFGGPSSSAATQVMVDAKGRIVVGGNISTPRLGTGGGFALARYLPG